MPSPDKMSELVSVFEKLGVSNPESFARSQLNEGIPQLSMVFFLYRAFHSLVREGDHKWIRGLTHSPRANPCGAALERILDRGTDLNDLVTFAKCAQRELLVDLIYIIDDATAVHFDDEDVRRSLTPIHWRLFQVDRNGAPIVALDGLHELLGEFDGPKNDGRSARDVNPDDH